MPRSPCALCASAALEAELGTHPMGMEPDLLHLPQRVGSAAPNEPTLTLMCNLAFVSKLSVVCLLASGPRGTSPFSFSKHNRRWARL